MAGSNNHAIADVLPATKTEKKVITMGVNTKILEKIRNDLKSILDDLQN